MFRLAEVAVTLERNTSLITEGPVMESECFILMMTEWERHGVESGKTICASQRVLAGGGLRLRGATVGGKRQHHRMW